MDADANADADAGDSAIALPGLRLGELKMTSRAMAKERDIVV